MARSTPAQAARLCKDDFHWGLRRHKDTTSEEQRTGVWYFGRAKFVYFFPSYLVMVYLIYCVYFASEFLKGARASRP